MLLPIILILKNFLAVFPHVPRLRDGVVAAEALAPRVVRVALEDYGHPVALGHVADDPQPFGEVGGDKVS